MKIAIFGGAFNPIHMGHTALANEAARAIGADLVWLVPSKKSPHKANDILAGDSHRLQMCRLAAQDIVRCEVNTIELDCDEISYTVNTLRKIHAARPEDELYLICGSDMFMSFLSWWQPHEIFKLATLVAAPRNGESEQAMLQQKQLLEREGARVLLLSADIPPYSSTEVRQRIQRGESVGDMLCSAVYSYINENKLYRG